MSGTLKEMVIPSFNEIALLAKTITSSDVKLPAGSSPKALFGNVAKKIV